MAHQGTRATRTGSAATSAPAFVGRDRELASIVDALADPPALVLIEGEAGIGKTRLLREALASQRLADRTALVAACPPLAEPFPLGPVVDGVRRVWQQVGDLVELSPLGGALRPLFPEWADQLPPALEPAEDPKETRHRLLRALNELVERLEVDILVVEDAHWADTSTLEWLLTLTTSEEPGLSVVVTFRPTDVPDGSLLPRLTARSPAGLSQLRVELAPLDVEQSRRLVGSMLGAEEVSEEFGSFLHDRTDGVPLAIEETVRLLRDREDIARRDGTWTRRIVEELQVPPTLRDSVLERVARLEDETRKVLEAAAVLASPADEPLLAEVADVDERAGRRSVAAALVSGLLREISPGRYVFRHVLDSQAVEGAIPISERRRLHHRAGEVLQIDDHPPVARLAGHYREAGDTEAWCHYAEAAADLAMESGNDHTTVLALLDLLTTIEHPLDRKVRLARKLGEAAFFGVAALGDLGSRVVGALRTVLGVADLPQDERGELRLLLGRMLWATGEDATAFEEMEAAIPDLGHRPDLAIRAMSNLALPLIPDWPAARHLHWLDRAGELVDQVPSSDRLAFLRVRVTTLLLFGDNAGVEAIDEFVEAASNPEDQQELVAGLLNVASAMLSWGRYDDARQRLTAALAHIKELDLQRLLTNVRVARAYVDWYTGAWQGLGDVAAEIAETQETAPISLRQIMGLLDLAAGSRAAAQSRLQEIAAEHASLGRGTPDTVLAPAALGRLRLADGAAEEALQVTAPVVEMIARKGVWLWATDIAPVHLDALVAAGRLNDAGEFVDQFGSGLVGCSAPAPAAAIVLCRAILTEGRGGLVESAALFAYAGAAWAALPRPYDELLALERQGRCLLTSGKKDEALVVLSDAQQRLSELGARWDADRVAQVLRQHGVDVARAWRGGRRGYGDQLSPRELEVVRLVSKGMTSREVGEVLFLSRRTVDRHLRTAMRKLDVRSRTALVATAAEAGLLSLDTGKQ